MCNSQSILSIKEDESRAEYLNRIYSLKHKGYLEMTWVDLADVLNENLGTDYSESKYRKDFYGFCKLAEADGMGMPEVDVNEELEGLVKIQKEKVKVRDERTQINAMIRRMAREETFKEIAEGAVAELINAGKLLPKPVKREVNNNVEGILLIGDWHYGLDVEVFNNRYNPEIAAERVASLVEEVINICKKESVNNLHLVNLGDMISGRIHLPLRINSRMDAVEQTMRVSELLSEFISILLAEGIQIDYYTVLDNHSRVEPNKKEQIQTESFCRLIDWWLAERLDYAVGEGVLRFHENFYGADIADFESCGHKIIAVHGDKDPQKSVISRLNMYTQEHYDLAVSAHMHHFTMDEDNETEFICNGSLIGTDDYAHGLRLNSKPSQTLIISTPANVTECIYKIKLA